MEASSKYPAVVNVNNAPAIGDGIVTTDFGTNASAESVTVQADGRILVAGSSNGDFVLARYNPNGTLDATFDDDGKLTTDVLGLDSAYDVTAQADGKILVAGTSWNGSKNFMSAVRYCSDGSLDSSFDLDGRVSVAITQAVGYSVTVQPDGRILIAGYTQQANTTLLLYDFALLRLNQDGSLDPSFDGDGKVITALLINQSLSYDVAVQDDGKILVAGYSSSYNRPGPTQDDRSNDFALVRYNSNGSLDTSFDADGKVTTDIGGGNDSGRHLLIQADGKILVAGSSYSNSSHFDFAIARYNQDGSLDSSFDGDGKTTTAIGASDDFAWSSTLQPDGKILVSGYRFNGTDYEWAIVRYNSDGSLDNGFHEDGIVTTRIVSESPFSRNSIALQDDGRILVASGGNGDFVLARYNTDGSLDTTFERPAMSATGVEDQSFSYIIPAGAFTDPDAGDTLIYTATKADGSALPTWLNFNTTTRSFSGTPGNSDVGTLNVKVTVTDTGGLSANDTLTVNVANVNDAPTGSVTINGANTIGSTLTATNTLADVDGLGTVSYQWQSSANGTSGWTAIQGATADTLVLGANYLGSYLRAVGSYTDDHGTAESSASNPVQETATVNLQAYSWKAHTLLDGVSVAAGTRPVTQTTDTSGSTSFVGMTDTSLPMTAARAIPSGETSLTDSAVNLQDAIAILKMIVGLDVNGAGKALSPYQAFAADYDGNGVVGLTDAIGVLKHVVGLPSPAPAWMFFNEADATVQAKANLNPGAVPATTADLSAATAQVHVGLVGVLRGDVDGSFAGASGAQDLDTSQSTYFNDLAATHGLNLSQFGIYPA